MTKRFIETPPEVGHVIVAAEARPANSLTQDWRRRHPSVEPRRAECAAPSAIPATAMVRAGAYKRRNALRFSALRSLAAWLLRRPAELRLIAAVALDAALEMGAHGGAGGGRVAGGDGVVDGVVLALDLPEIGGLRRAVALPDAQGLARGDVVAEIVEEVLEIGIAGRIGDCAM